MQIAADSVTNASLEGLSKRGYIVEVDADNPEFITVYKAKEETNEAVASEAAS